MAIWVPMADGTEPAAANGPERSKIVPMRIGGSWATANLLPRLAAATVAAERCTNDLRDTFMGFLREIECQHLRLVFVGGEYSAAPGQSQRGSS